MADPVARTRRRHSLGSRLAAIVATTLFAVIGGAGALAVATTADAYREEARQRAASMLAMLSVPAALAIADSTYDRLDGYLSESVRPGGQDVQLHAVVAFDSAGRAVAGSIDALGPPPIPGVGVLPSARFCALARGARNALWQTIAGAGHKQWLLVAVPAVSGLRWGTLVGVFDVNLVERRIEAYRMLLIAIAFAVAGLIAVVTYAAFSRLAVRPMASLAAAAEAIRAGRHEVRLGWSRRDELGQIAASFDHMAGEVERYTTDLEQKVAERSAEVEAKNRDLQGVNARLREAVAELERLAHVDPLTAVANRRSFDVALDQFVAAPADRPWAMLMVDVDHFKRVNDTFGHPVGDVVLREVARLLRDELRGSDRIARYGGEEFAILLASTQPEAAHDVARRLGQVIADHDFSHTAGVTIGRITVSIGIANHPVDAVGREAIIAHTDQALYAAKTAGRNRVVRWTASLVGAPGGTTGATGGDPPAGQETPSPGEDPRPSS